MKRTLFNNTLRKRSKIIGLFFIASLFMVSCSSQRVVTTEEQGQRIKDEGERIRTVYVPSAHMTLTIDGQAISSRAYLSTTIDSLIILSIQPLPGMEMFRLEATPEDVIVFDKTSMEYIPLTYESLRPYFSSPITFKDIQDVATGAILPRDRNKTLRAYSIAGRTVVLEISYPEIRTNVPVNTNRLPIVRFAYKTLDQVFQ